MMYKLTKNTLLTSSLSCLLLFILAGCTAQKTPQDIKADQLYHIVADRPVTCIKGDDCHKKWARAIEWVREHNIAYTRNGRKISYPISKLTSNVIQTSASKLPETQFRIIRFPKEDGSYGIDYSSQCDLSDECFNRYGKLLKMSFVSSIIGLPEGVTQTGPQTYTAEPGVFLGKAQ